MKEKEKSAIDAIYDISDEIKQIRQEMVVMDNNIKILNNKINKLIISLEQNSLSPKKVKAEAPIAIIPSNKPKPDDDPLNDSLIKVFGRIKNQHKKPIKDVYITIYNPRGEIIKNRTSDAEGYWEARVSPGKYVVELNAKHINKKSNPVNMNIEIDETMREFEVSGTNN